MTHTPGPWGCEVNEFGTVITSEGRSLGTAHGTIIIKGGEWPHEANGRLMAAAPDLLEALKETLAIAKRDEFGDYVIRAEAAIAKAEGRS